MSQHSLQVVNYHYSGWGDQQLVDDLFTFSCTNGRNKPLWKRLADQIGNTQRASKERKRATEEAFTRSDAVRSFSGPWDAETKVCGIIKEKVFWFALPVLVFLLAGF